MTTFSQEKHTHTKGTQQKPRMPKNSITTHKILIQHNNNNEFSLYTVSIKKQMENHTLILVITSTMIFPLV